MKKILMMSAACVFAFSGSAMLGEAVAQGSSITVIHEDGTQDVIELGGKAAKPAAEQRDRRAPKVEIVPREAKKSVIFNGGESSGSVADPVVEAVPVLPRVERIVDPVSQPKEVVKEVEPVAAPDKKVRKKPVPKPAAKKKAKKKASSAAKKPDVLAIIPPRKPHRQAVPAGEVITKEKALYIALSEAPPAKDVQVYPREGVAGIEYSVIFKTEDGKYEVVVDGVSGVIKGAGAVDGGESFVKPGHLPAR